MDLTVKQMWLDALRSNRYRQSQGGLSTVWGFCPLGVLCDLYSKFEPSSGWVEPGTVEEWHRAIKETKADKEPKCCPECGQEVDEDEEEYWAGLGVDIDSDCTDEDDLSQKDEQRLFQLNGCRHYLPCGVVAWAGLLDKDPVLDGRTITNVNDIAGLDFDEIADMIEEYL